MPTTATTCLPEGEKWKWQRLQHLILRRAAAEAAAKKAYDLGMRKVEVFVRGLGPGREAAIRSIAGAGIEITAINDVTPIPHNGCRPPKRPRG